MKLDTQFASMNAGAHRRPSPLVGTPALVWHRAFWRIDQQSLKAWEHEVDLLLSRLFYAELDDAKGRKVRLPSSPNYDTDSDGLSLFRHRTVGRDLKSYGSDKHMRNDMFSMTIHRLGFPITVRAVCHFEYWELSIILDMSRAYKNIASSSDINDIKSNLDNVYENIINRYSGIDTSDLCDDVHSSIVSKFRALSDKIFSERGVELYNPANFGGMFVDVVGILLGLCPREEDKNRIEPVYQVKRPAPLQEIIQPRSRFEALSAMKALDAAWPFVKKLNRPAANVENDEINISGKAEYTATLFHGGRSLFISSLGKFIPESELFGDLDESQMPDPAIYVLINTHPSRWQLGRLIERINDMEVLRVAALRDFENLMNANNNLRRVQECIYDGNANEAKSIYQGIGRNIPSGLSFRVERANYYIDRFRDIISQMRLDRVEGLQRYDEFISRRVNDKFVRIRDIGRRYETVRSEVRLMLEIQRSTEIDRSRKLTNILLSNAEWIIAFPLVYYFSSLLEHNLHINPMWSLFFSSSLVGALLYILHERRHRAMRERSATLGGI